MPKVAPLSPKQKRFVEEYLIDLNGTQAALRAGYSLKTAPVIASENLRKPYIQEALRARQEQLRDANAVTPERVIQEYARLAFADMAAYVAWGPEGIRAVPSSELPEGATRAVAEVTETITDKGRTFRFKLHDKKGALDSLAKHLGMFVDTNVTINQDNRSINVNVDHREALEHTVATLSARASPQSSTESSEPGTG